MKLQHYYIVNLISEDRKKLSESNRLLLQISPFPLSDFSEHKETKDTDLLNLIKYFRGSWM